MNRQLDPGQNHSRDTSSECFDSSSVLRLIAPTMRRTSHASTSAATTIASQYATISHTEKKSPQQQNPRQADGETHPEPSRVIQPLQLHQRRNRSRQPRPATSAAPRGQRKSKHPIDRSAPTSSTRHTSPRTTAIPEDKSHRQSNRHSHQIPVAKYVYPLSRRRNQRRSSCNGCFPLNSSSAAASLSLATCFRLTCSTRAYTSPVGIMHSERHHQTASPTCRRHFNRRAIELHASPPLSPQSA